MLLGFSFFIFLLLILFCCGLFKISALIQDLEKLSVHYFGTKKSSEAIKSANSLPSRVSL